MIISIINHTNGKLSDEEVQHARRAIRYRRFEPGFRSCDRQKARGATLPQRSRWVSASEQTSISGASRGCRAS